MRKKIVVVALLLAVFLAANSALSASLDYDIPWWTMESGGVSQGGNYTLRSVIGQPDSSSLNGGNFSLQGGFLGIKRSPQNKIYLPLVSH